MERLQILVASTAIILVFVIALLLSYFIPHCNVGVFEGWFIFLSAIATSILAIHQYQNEQRASRIQKVYFEDTLLGIAKSMEETMSKTNKNFLLTENFYNVMKNLLCQEKLDSEIIKNNLLEILDRMLKSIKIDMNATDFKKETMSKLLYDSIRKGNMLPAWIKNFEDDSYRFSSFLQDQILILKVQLNRLSEKNLQSFEDVLHDILGEYVVNNYLLIRRHYILFSLFSEIVLELSSKNYSSVQNVIVEFKKERIIRIRYLIDEIHKEVIADFALVDIGNITKEDAARLSEKIECSWKKVKEGLL